MISMISWDSLADHPHVVIFERLGGITVEEFDGHGARDRAHAAAVASCDQNLVRVTVAARIRILGRIQTEKEASPV